MLDCLHDPKKMITLPHYKTVTVIHCIAFKTALRGYPTVQLYDCIFYIRRKLYILRCYFSIWLRTGSNPADINQFLKPCWKMISKMFRKSRNFFYLTTQFCRTRFNDIAILWFSQEDRPGASSWQAVGKQLAVQVGWQLNVWLRL